VFYAFFSLVQTGRFLLSGLYRSASGEIAGGAVGSLGARRELVHEIAEPEAASVINQRRTEAKG
jgi:hypothetical protein